MLDPRKLLVELFDFRTDQFQHLRVAAQRTAENYPNLRIDIQIGRSRWLASALRRGDIDLAIDVAPHEGFQSMLLRVSPVVWIAGASFHYQQKFPLPLVLIDSACVFRNEALEALDEAGLPWKEAFQTTTLGGIRAALRAGLGVTSAHNRDALTRPQGR